MLLLLDTHTLLWSADDPGKIPTSAMSLGTYGSNEVKQPVQAMRRPRQVSW